MRITSRAQMMDAFAQTGIPFSANVQIRASFYEIEAVNVIGGRITSLMGRMTAGRGKVGMVYKIPMSLYLGSTRLGDSRVGVANGTAPAAPYQPRENPHLHTGVGAEVCFSRTGVKGKPGDKFFYGRHEFTLTGFNTIRPKKPIVVTRDDGRQMKCTIAFINSVIR